MQVWECPRCNAVVKAVATQVVHRCPSYQNKHVDFAPQESKAGK